MISNQCNILNRQNLDLKFDPLPVSSATNTELVYIKLICAILLHPAYSPGVGGIFFFLLVESESSKPPKNKNKKKNNVWVQINETQYNSHPTV